MPGRRWISTLPVFVAVICATSAAFADVDLRQFQEDLTQLAAPATRVVGSEGYSQAGAYLEKQLRTLPNVDYRRHEFPVMVPVTHEASLNHDGKSEPIYPFWPAQVRVNATPADGIKGKLVYVGDANFEHLKPADVAGQIAVVEASAGQWWSNAFYFGARAVLILGSPDTNNFDLRSHELFAPVNLPRFYVPPGKLNDDLRAGRISGDVTVKASVDWERKSAANFYALVPGNSDSQSAGPALMISIPYDSTGLVPDLARGASQAVQAACGLALLRDLSAHPWNRPVIVFFGGADGIQMLATRNMFMALSDVPALWSPQVAQVDEHLTAVMHDLDRLRQVASDPTQLDPARDRDAIDRVSTIIQTDAAIELDQFFRLRREQTIAQPDEIVRLDVRQTLLNRLRYTFIQRPRDLTADLAEPAKEYIRRTIDRLDALFKQEEARRGELQKRIDLYHWLASRLGRESDPSLRANDNRLIELLIALDLSDHGQRVGPMYVGRFQNYTNISQIQEYREWFAKVERRFQSNQPDAAWWKQIQGVIDFDPFIAARSPTTWLCAPMAIGSELCQGWGVPGFSMITLDDLRLRRDTPTDTPENLESAAIQPQLLALREMLFHAWNDPTFKGQPDLKWQRTSFTGQVVSPAPGKPVPDLPREGFLATYYYTANNIPHIPQPKVLPWAMGVRRNEIRDTDAEGNYRFEGMPRLGGSAGGAAEMQMLAVEVFKTEPKSGAITACTDLGKQLGDLKLYADIRQDLEPLRSVGFACEEFALVGLYDPRFLQSLGEVIPLDARRNAEPQRYGAVVQNQMMAGYVEPGALTSLLFRYGRVGNRLMLINMSGAATSKARGFSAGALDKPGPLALLTTNDFYHLDEKRLEEYRRAGVTSSLIDAMQSDAAQQLDQAQAAQKKNDGAALMQHATGSWANNARVYLAAQDMANDVVRGAIFLLLLCVPFSFCIERLLVGTPSIYKQITGVACVFAIMTAALWSFHPAFKISSSPLIIVLAFAIIFMSVAVIFVVYGKFDTELKKISSGRADDSFTLARAGVLSSAILLGIANMRKRKFRTALTSITIVLITFAVLCFTSARKYLDTTTLPTGVASSYPGIMLRQRGYRPLPEVIVQNLRPLMPGRTIVERWWNANPSDPRDQIHLTAGGKDEDGGLRMEDGKAHSSPSSILHPPSSSSISLPVVAFLGLSPGESQLSKIADVIGREKFARLEKGERDIIYLPRTIADALKVHEGDTVRAGGISLKIAAVFDPVAFDKNVATLSGDPLAPLKYAAGALDADGRQLSDVSAAESFSLDANSSGGELGATYEHLPASQFAIIPASISQLLPNAALRSIAVRLDGKENEDGGSRIEDGKNLASAPSPSSILHPPSSFSDETVKQTSDELARRFAIALFAGYSDGVRMVSASNLTAVSGAGQVAIPLAIAGLIIFNTMMGSIAERKREIHVYTSLGLAPLHVGALFVAEAMTYGLIGTVFGYVIGQGVGTLLLKLGWLGQVTLNYSGTAAISTMGLILLIVLLSALVPARLASRLAAPSIDRSWKVPLPADDQIKADLPFTINKTAADGALAYLADFFDAHREGTIGKFSAGKVEVFSTIFEQRTENEDGGSRIEDGKSVPPASSPSSILHPPSSSSPSFARGLRTDIWLTPFDLGIRQRLELLIHPGQFQDIYEVQVILHRLSGDDASWYRMNRTFLTELRKQFLQWRSLSPQKMLAFVEASHALFPAENVR